MLMLVVLEWGAHGLHRGGRLTLSSTHHHRLGLWGGWLSVGCRNAVEGGWFPYCRGYV